MEVHLNNWQTQVWQDNHRYKVINIGRRGGKTTLAALQVINFSVNNPNTITWYIAPSYKMAKQILWEMLRTLMPDEAVDKRNETELSMRLKNNSIIVLKGADNPDSLRGVRIDLAVFDEVAFFNRWDEVWKVMRPTLADSKADVIFISTPNGFNHFKDMSEKHDPDWAYFHFTTYDNPHIPREEIEAMKNEMDEDSFAQEIMGEFRKMSGLVYKDFNRDTHMIEIPELNPIDYTFFRSLDFGFGHKTALGYFAVNSIGTEIFMFDGLYQSGLTIQDLAGAIKIKDIGHRYAGSFADSAQPMFLEELSRENVLFNPVEKGPDSVVNGISKVASLLKIRADTGKPTLRFAKHLTWVADEFEHYRWMENKSQDIIKQVPLKKDDDAMDMIRYFAMSYIKPAPVYVKPVSNWGIA